MPSLITNLINIEYLTGFKSSNTVLLRTTTRDYLFTDCRYLEKAKKIAVLGRGRIRKFTVVNMGKDFQGTLENLLKKHRIKTLEFEASNMTVKQLETFKKWTSGITWKPGALNILEKRARKDANEIQAIKKSQEINEQLFYSTLKRLKLGVTELEIAKFIKQTCYKYGAEDIAFEPIIAFGQNSSIPHHQNTNKRLKKGDIILIDMGVKYKGYCSDMTRTVFTASPTPKQAEIYKLVLKAQKEGIKSIKPGISGKTPDKIIRKIMCGFQEKFIHSTGHGIGMEIHESPNISAKSKDKLKPGMVVTCEPGIYFTNEFGIRIEDMILITKSGPRNLTRALKTIKDCILRLN